MAKVTHEAIDAYLKKLGEREEKKVTSKLKRLKRTEDKTCIHCKERFTGGGTKQRFCKISCYRSYMKEQYHKTKQITVVKGICVHCGNEFESVRKGKVYCTAECRNSMRRKIYHDRYAIAFGIKE